MFQLSSKSKQRREGVDPRLIEISDLAIQITVVDFGHPADAGKRTVERQNELYLDGKSKADGYNKLSRHQSGKALDFYAFVDGKASWDTEHLAMVAAAFLQAASILGYKLKWGGLWKSFKDYPHVELVD
jgi:peptidoglycan L-alanyl-D-glutamate endopeptidase CwlK